MDIKFKKFEPMTDSVRHKVEYLIKRGGIIVSENRSHLLIQRLDSVAKIDQYGRVEWSANK